MLTIGFVLKALGVEMPLKKDQVITGGCIDSRLAEPGSLFVALPGEFTDGHNLDQAFGNGAVLALIDRPIISSNPVIDLSMPVTDLPHTAFSIIVPNALEALQQVAAAWRKEFDIPVVGITGSVGKSSTKEVLTALLGYKFNVLKNQGNRNNEIGLPLTLLSLSNKHQVAVLEMGFYVPGEIKLLCDISQPQIGIVTNIGTVHAERAGDLKTIARGKAELVQALPPAPQGVAILNQDDAFVREMAEETKASVFSYGLSNQAELWADEIRSQGAEGIKFTAHHAGKSYPLCSTSMGRHSVYNLLCSIGAALHLGMSWYEIDQSLRTQEALQRVRLFKSKAGAVIVDDSYNASPLSTIAALDFLDELEGEKITILGDMLELGQYEAEGHQQVLNKATLIAKSIVLIGPRYKKTLDQAVFWHFPREKILWFEDAETASDYLSHTLHEGQTALVKGSHGMEMYKIIEALEVNS
jgi:UDP-N-acetylmuramoyl-tripeptide--D-alanyl-D-alanine ligase